MWWVWWLVDQLNSTSFEHILQQWLNVTGRVKSKIINHHIHQFLPTTVLCPIREALSFAHSSCEASPTKLNDLTKLINIEGYWSNQPQQFVISLLFWRHLIHQRNEACWLAGYLNTFWRYSFCLSNAPGFPASSGWYVSFWNLL